MATALLPTDRTLVESGASQAPLLHPSQLLPGCFLTGLAYEHVWEVLRVEGDCVVVRKVGTTPADGAAATRSQAIAALLPARPTVPRTHVLSPLGPLTLPDSLTIYIGRGGVAGTAGIFSPVSHAWASALPIIPRLGVLWTLPPAARRLMEEE